MKVLMRLVGKKCPWIKYKKPADLYVTADRKLMRILLQNKSYVQKNKTHTHKLPFKSLGSE